MDFTSLLYNIKVKLYVYCIIIFILPISITQDSYCLAPPLGNINLNQIFSIDSCFDDISKRYSILTENTISKSEIRAAVVGIFGMNDIEEPWNDPRVDNAIKAIYNSDDPEKYLAILIPLLDDYKGTTSGKHRYIPLAQALINIFRNKNIFSCPTDEMNHKVPALRYLTESYLLHANPSHVDPSLIPPHIPFLVLPLPKTKPTYRWLDIGSAPKIGGSPAMATLRTISDNLLPENNIEITATDLNFPRWSIQDNGSIIPNNEYQFDAQGRCALNGVLYLNARNFPEYDVMNDQFNLPDRYDFISLCRVLHQLRNPGEQSEFLSLSDEDIQFINKDGLQDDIKDFFYPSQKKAIKKLLSLLTIGGIMFAELSIENPKDIWQWFPARHNADVFFIIQRKNQKEFIIYDEFIPFRASNEPYRSRDILLNKKYKGTLSNPGFYWMYPGLQDNIYEELGTLLDAADKITYPYQQRPFSILTSLWGAIFAVAKWGDLTIVFENYLSFVPDECKEKLLLMDRVRVLWKTIQSFTPENSFKQTKPIEIDTDRIKDNSN